MLKRLLNNFEHPCSGRFGDLFDEVRELLDTPEPAPTEKAIAYWDTQNGTLIPAVPLSSERTCFKVPLIPLYLHPRSDIVDELVEALKGVIESTTHICEGAYGPGMDGSFDKARAALKKLEESHEI